MSNILKLILKSEDKKVIRNKLKKGHSQIPLFKSIKELKNRSLFEHLKKYRKLKKWTLKDFVKAGAVDLEETNDKGQTLLQIFIIKNDLANLIMLLQHEVFLSKKDYRLAKKNDANEITEFLDYRPGDNEISIFEFCSTISRDETYKKDLNALIFDQADTTEDESSEAEDIDTLNLSYSTQKKINALRKSELKKYNQKQEDNGTLCLVAARGIHFSPTYFKTEAIEQIKQTKEQMHPAYSQSMLFDTGYLAGDEVDETDKQIRKRHNHILKFIEKLKNTPDHKEKKIGTLAPAASRNKIEFDSLYYRYMQVYINSYNRLFNKGAIKVDFGFDTKNNPEVSASWSFIKGAMYASGARINWNKSKLRKDPHYRRFTGKPKHPNIGYLDVYVFDIDYVRTNGFDRQIMCQEGFIKLNAFYRHEAEIIFHSAIPVEFHERRYIISLPALNMAYSTELSKYGIASRRAYNMTKEKIRSLPANKHSDEYKREINSITEKTATAQASLIEQTTHYRLFKAKKPKVAVYDHGEKLSSEILTL
ncbi:MAG: hypothetical protein WC785_00675 [Tatlockia sp.]|jgi:hypothetical protein